MRDIDTFEFFNPDEKQSNNRNQDTGDNLSWLLSDNSEFDYKLDRIMIPSYGQADEAEPMIALLLPAVQAAKGAADKAEPMVALLLPAVQAATEASVHEPPAWDDFLFG